MILTRAIHPITRRALRSRLQREWKAAANDGHLDPRIPDPNINYNQDQTGTVDAYVALFIERACRDELPALLELAAFDEAQPSFSMLDYGCGLARLAYAFTERFGRDERHRYIGYEIHPDAVEFVTKAYASYPNVSVISDRLRLSDSYVEIRQSAAASDAGVSAEAVVLAGRLEAQVDLQFSHSVFTHMYREPIVHVLKELSEVVRTQGVCVNTWLIVDDEVKTNLAAGKADRKLPFFQDGFWTYDKKNPLMCSAYEVDAVRSIYDDADHEILDIRWGTWSGRRPTQEFTYQDVVISRPRS